MMPERAKITEYAGIIRRKSFATCFTIFFNAGDTPPGFVWIFLVLFNFKIG